MAKKEFTKFELARMKRTAQNVEGFLKQKNKLEEKKAKIVVSEQQLSLAIGKQGQNVRLAAKLTGYGIDIKSEAEPEEHTEEENLEEEYVEPSELSLDEE